MNVDTVLEVIGPLGLGQTKLVVVLTVIRIYFALQIYSFQFSGRDVGFDCHSAENGTLLSGRNVCPDSTLARCKNLRFDDEKEEEEEEEGDDDVDMKYSSLVSQFRLVCDR